MKYFRVDHPPEELILCTRSQCEDIADYLEVNEHGGENFACAAHTSSEKHASVLPKGVPSAELYQAELPLELSAELTPTIDPSAHG